SGKERLIERLEPLLVGRFEDVGAPAEADVVDQDIETAERFEGPVEYRLNTGRRRQVGRYRNDPVLTPGELPEVGGGLVQLLLSACADGNPASFSNERFRDRQTEALARSGDDGDFVSQLQIHREYLGELVNWRVGEFKWTLEVRHSSSHQISKSPICQF